MYIRRSAKLSAPFSLIQSNMEQQSSRIVRNVKVIVRLVPGSDFNVVEESSYSNGEEVATVVFENKKVEKDGAIRLTLSIPNTDKVS